MPQFDVVSISEAKLRATGNVRAEVLREYIEFIEQLTTAQAGKLQPQQGKTPRTTRRRLGDAGRLAGKDLVIKKDGEGTYFWLKTRRPGRPRKNS